jgi:hypothetical protein
MKKCKVAIPVLLLLLLAGAGCRKDDSFDIRGQWSFTSDSEVASVCTFTGQLESGTVTRAYPDTGSGRYSVSGGVVTFDFHTALAGGSCCDFSGSIVSEGLISGTMKITAAHSPWEWTLDVEGQRQ